MTQPYRAALLGLGKIARAHLRGYRAAENAERIAIVAGADVSEEARQRFAEETGVERVYADYRELLHQERPDLVSICTWPPLHPEMVEAAAAAGAKGILCEKPMAVDLAGADRMVAAAQGAGAVLAVGHQRRLLPRYTSSLPVRHSSLCHSRTVCSRRKSTFRLNPRPGPSGSRT